MAEPRVTRVLVLVAVVLLVVAAYRIACGRANREIERVEERVTALQRQRDSIQDIVAGNAVTLEQLFRTRDETQARLTVVRRHVDSLERERRDSQITVRNIRKTPALQARLEQTFPEIARSNWGLTSIPFEPGDTLGIEYFLIPAWFTETFIIDHQNAESWREQRHKLLAVDSLRLEVVALQDSIATLHAQNALAFESGYHTASTEYDDLSTRYIAELRKPRFSLGSTLTICLGSAGAGALIATLVNR